MASCARIFWTFTVLFSRPVIVRSGEIHMPQDDSEDRYFNRQMSKSELLSCELERKTNMWCSLTPHGLWPSNKPSLRKMHATAFYSRMVETDKRLKRMLLFGGLHLSSNLDSGDDYSSLQDTWIYCPKVFSWTKLDFARSPTRRGDHTLTTLCSTRVFLYGGISCSDPFCTTDLLSLNDTWLFNGITEKWIEVRTTLLRNESFPGRPVRAFAVLDGENQGNCSCNESLFLITTGEFGFENLQFWLLRCVNDGMLDLGIAEYRWERMSSASSMMPSQVQTLYGANVDYEMKSISLLGKFTRPFQSEIENMSLCSFNLGKQKWKCKINFAKRLTYPTRAYGYYKALNTLIMTNGPTVMAWDVANGSPDHALSVNLDKSAIHERFSGASAAVDENDLLVHGGTSSERNIYPADSNVWQLRTVSRTKSSISVQWKRDGSSPISPDIFNLAAAYATINNTLVFLPGISSDMAYSEGPIPKPTLHTFLKKFIYPKTPVVWILDFKTYRWWEYQTEDYPTAVPATASVISYKDDVVLCGGFITTSTKPNNRYYFATNKLWVYVGSSRVWVKATADDSKLPSPRALASIASLQNFTFLYFGGVTTNWNNTVLTALNDLWLLTINTSKANGVIHFHQKWKKLVHTEGQQWPPKVFGHSGFYSLAFNSMFIFGGSVNSSCQTNSMWKFNLTTYLWTRCKIRNSFAPRQNFLCQYQATLLGKRIVVADNEAFSAQCEKLINQFRGFQSVRATVKTLCSKFRGLWMIDFEKMEWIRLTKYQTAGLRYQLFFPWTDRVVTIMIKQTEENGLSTSMWSFKPGCFPGYYSPDFALMPCTVCAKGNYSSSAGSIECSLCPKGMTTGQEGSTSFANCSCIAEYCGHGKCVPVTNRDFVICNCDAGFTGTYCETPTFYLIGVGAFFVAILVGIFSGCLAICWRRRKKQAAALKTAQGSLENTERRLNVEQEAWTIDQNKLVVYEEIASGGFGVVYRGEYCGSVVAIKKLKQEIVEVMKHDTKKEFDMMKRVRHRNIVQFIGAILRQDGVAPAFVVEFMENGSLRGILNDFDIDLDYVRKLRFALDAAKGMHYLHSLDPPWIHRDLKSENLLVDDNWCVKVADFGCALLLRNKNKPKEYDEPVDDYDKEDLPLIRLPPQNPLKYSSYSFGTALWKAPEAVLKKGYGTSADVYSFGIVLWEILTRRFPFENVQGQYRFMCDLMDDIVAGKRPAIPPYCPQNYSKLITTCWEADTNARPTFKQVKDYLRQLLTDEGSTAFDSLNSEHQQSADNNINCSRNCRIHSDNDINCSRNCRIHSDAAN